MVDEQQAEIWTALLNLSIGELIAWILVIAAILGAIATATIKIYKVFDKYKQLKDEREYVQQSIKRQDAEINSISEQLKEFEKNFTAQVDSIRQILEDNRETKIKELRHTLTNAGEKALKDGQLTAREWTSLNEMYDEYSVKYKQNHYVKTLMEKVNNECKIVGSLDD